MPSSWSNEIYSMTYNLEAAKSAAKLKKKKNRVKMRAEKSKLRVEDAKAKIRESACDMAIANDFKAASKRLEKLVSKYAALPPKDENNPDVVVEFQRSSYVREARLLGYDLEQQAWL